MTQGPGAQPDADASLAVGDGAARCGAAVLAQIDASAVQLGQAVTMLDEQLGQLRRHFSGAMAADATEAGQRAREQHLQAAIVGLQCEDTLGQMLNAIRLRTVQLADALREALPDLLSPERATDGDLRARSAAISHRLRALESSLEAVGGLPQPVTHHALQSGPIELF